MNKNTLLLVVLITSISSFTSQTKWGNTLFGDHVNRIKTLEDGVYRIFADLNGDFYPENIIAETELRDKGKCQLSIWAKNYPSKFGKLAKTYNLTDSIYSEQNYLILQDSIRSSIVQVINQHSDNSQTWLIHGFRKLLYQKSQYTPSNSTSAADNANGVSKITKYLNDKGREKEFIIELYWDGRYGSTAGLKKIKAGLVFKNQSVPSAQKIGYSLRRIYSGIKCQNINLISHSTGTHIVTSLLFNIKKRQIHPTPNQNIKVVLLASASSGKRQFKNYYSRNTNINYQEKDNYRILNVYNIKDFVLLKQNQSGTSPKLSRFLGKTTLGCNRFYEARKLDEYFDKKFKNSDYENANLEPVTSHLFKTYMRCIRIYSFLYD